MNRCLVTVMHTGTIFYRTQMWEWWGEFPYQHCSEEALEMAATKEWVATTYRDPERVAASWGNREKFDADGIRAWHEQWSCYARLLDLDPLVFQIPCPGPQHGLEFAGMPLNGFEDRHGLHGLLSDGRRDEFYAIIRPEWVEFAREASEDVWQRLSS